MLSYDEVAQGSGQPAKSERCPALVTSGMKRGYVCVPHNKAVPGRSGHSTQGRAVEKPSELSAWSALTPRLAHIPPTGKPPTVSE